MEEKSLGFTHYDGHAYPNLFVFQSFLRESTAPHRRSCYRQYFGPVFPSARQKWWDRCFLRIFVAKRSEGDGNKRFSFSIICELSGNGVGMSLIGGEMREDMLAFTLMATEVLQSIQAEARLAVCCIE